MVPSHDPSYLGLFVDIGDNHVVKKALCIGFKQEREIKHEDPIRVLFRTNPCLALIFGIDPWVDDLIELSAFLGVAKNKIPKPRAINFTIMIYDGSSKGSNDFSPNH